jgi:hypothetical protein
MENHHPVVRTIALPAVSVSSVSRMAERRNAVPIFGGDDTTGLPPGIVAVAPRTSAGSTGLEPASAEATARPRRSPPFAALGRAKAGPRPPA